MVSPYLEAKGRIICPRCDAEPVKTMHQCVDCGGLVCNKCAKLLDDDNLCKTCHEIRDVRIAKLNSFRLKYTKYDIDETVLVQGVPVKMLTREDLIKIFVAKEPK